MHGRHPHQRGKGHNAAHKTDLRQPKRARICATDCGSPHQTSVPVSCGRSPQLVSHVTVYCLREYARNSARRVEATQKANKTKHNTQHPPTPKPPPSSCRKGQEIVSTPVDKYKQISVSKSHPTGLDWCGVVFSTAGSSAAVLFWVSRGYIQQLLLLTVTVLSLKRSFSTTVTVHCYCSESQEVPSTISAFPQFTQTSASCTSCLDDYWFESTRN